MRIAIPIHSFEPGGVERVALRLAKRWQDAGEEVVIVLGRDRGRCRAEAPALDYRARKEIVPTDRWETLWMIWSMLRFLRRERVDVIFCPGNTYTVVCIAMKILLGGRCPPVLVKVSNDLDRQDMPRPLRPFYRWWLRWQGAWLERFVALAEPMRRQIERMLGLLPGQVPIIPDPALSRADLDRLAGCGRDREAGAGCRFVSVGRLSAQKRQALMIEAFARHALDGDTLLIAGEGPWRRRLEELVARHGLSDRVFLPGHCDDIAAVLAQADVFVLSSDYEGVPAALLEALAAGLPIVATECCASIYWLLGHGRFGVLVPCGDADALGAAMNAAPQVQPDRAAMREFAARFTLERSAGLYLSEMASLRSASRRMRKENLRPAMREPGEAGV